MNGKKASLLMNGYRILNVEKLLDFNFTEFSVIITPSQQNMHGLANYISKLIRKKYKVFAFPYRCEDQDHIIVLGDADQLDLENDLKDAYWSITKVKFGSLRDERSSLIIKLLQELFNYILTYKYGYYKVINSFMNTSYRIIKGTLAQYRLYEGFFMRVFGNSKTGYYVAFDPTRRLTYDEPLIKFIRRGTSDRMIGKGMLGIYTRSDFTRVLRYGILRRIDYKHTISTYKLKTPIYAVKSCGEVVSLKDYYNCVVNAVESFIMEGNEPVVFLDRTPYPPNILYPILRTEDLRNEIRDIKRIYFLTPEERVTLTRKARDLLASNKVLNLPEIKLTNEPLEFSLKTLSIPKLLIGNNLEITPDISDNSNYKRKLLKALRNNGTYKKAIRPGEVLIFYKEKYGISEEMLYNLYCDLLLTAEKEFRVKLPNKPVIRAFNDVNEIEDILKIYKDKISLVLVIMGYRQDENYFVLKNIFNNYDIPSQMLTLKIIDYYYNQGSHKGKNKYTDIKRNLILGALGKAGIVPWILKDELKADLYIGYDIGHYPTRDQPSIASLVFMDKKGSYIFTRDIKLGSRRKLVLSKDSIRRLTLYLKEVLSRFGKKRIIKEVVVHKDGDIYDDDINVFRQVTEDLGLKIAMVSIKKSKGYRIYRKLIGTNDQIEAPKTGDYIVLGNKALLVGMGREFIKQGTPVPILIELKYVDKGFDYTINDALNDVFKLTFIHWQVITSKIKLPATILYADEWAYLGTRQVSFADMPPL